MCIIKHILLKCTNFSYLSIKKKRLHIVCFPWNPREVYLFVFLLFHFLNQALRVCIIEVVINVWNRRKIIKFSIGRNLRHHLLLANLPHSAEMFPAASLAYAYPISIWISSAKELIIS